VASRTSTFALKGKNLGAAEIGQILNVKTILEGSVRRMDRRVRISAQLVSTGDGYPIWSERYDRDVEDVFQIQDEIARHIVDQLKLKLTPAQHQALAKRYTENVEAYELYLRGRHSWHHWNVKDGLAKAIHFYEAALSQDPDYALAYSGLADAYHVPGVWGITPASAVLPKAMAAATRAVEIAPDLAESRTSLGFVQFLDWDREAAESSFLHAIDSNPRYALAHTFLAWLLSSLERPREAAEAARIGLELDPLSPTTNGIAALVSYHARHYDQAVSECERALDRDERKVAVEVIHQPRQERTLPQQHKDDLREREMGQTGWTVVRFYRNDVEDDLYQCIRCFDEMVLEISKGSGELGSDA
jgi:tetratricopeptide (TPR) repeat protein